MRQDNVSQVIVIGGGAAGLAVAYGLVMRGLTVTVLEFGPVPDHQREFMTDTPPEILLRHGRSGRGQESDGAEAYPAAHLISDADAPYRLGIEAGRSFLKRVRVAGGKTLYWTAHALRFGDLEFQARTLTGHGEDWPINHATLSTWYAAAEQLMGVTGQPAGLIQHPDGQFRPPLFGLRAGEQQLQAALARRGVPLVLARKAISNGERSPACHGCGRCVLGCRTAAKYDAFSGLFPVAVRTGRLTLRSNTIVTEITLDANRWVRGVNVLNRQTGATTSLTAQVVVVAASAIETARLLLASPHPDGGQGIANSSGLVGAFLSESLGVEIEGWLPALKSTVRKPGATADTPHHGEHGLIPRHVNLSARSEADFGGGWLFLTESGPTPFPSPARLQSGFGRAWKQSLAAWHPASIRLQGIAEVGMRRENHIRLDPHQVDTWGRPLPKVSFALSDEDHARWQAMVDAGCTFLDAVGADHITVRRMVAETGGGLHACGTCRMGNDPRTSVTNGFGQTHDIPNLFIADASLFVSSLNQPTLTVTALALRQAHFIAGWLRHPPPQR